MFNVGSQELLIILFVVLMLFGAKRIPEVARSFGKGMREFKSAMRGFEDEFNFDEPASSGRPGTGRPRKLGSGSRPKSAGKASAPPAADSSVPVESDEVTESTTTAKKPPTTETPTASPAQTPKSEGGASD